MGERDLVEVFNGLGHLVIDLWQVKDTIGTKKHIYLVLSRFKPGYRGFIEANRLNEESYEDTTDSPEYLLHRVEVKDKKGLRLKKNITIDDVNTDFH